jgi:VWFA-related protein
VKTPNAALAALVAIFLAAGALLDAQDPPPVTKPPATQPAQPPAQPPAGQRQPPIRTGTELVRVDVAVIDHQGKPVPQLTAQDFELEQDGEKQQIQSFQYVEVNGQPGADDELTLTIRSRSHAATEASKEDVRVFLVFWDEYHIGQMASATRAKTALHRWVRTAFGPKDLVAFMDPLTPLDAIRFTRDRLELAEHVRTLRGRSGVYIPTRSAIEDAHLERGGDVERLRSEVTISALKAAAVYLGGLRDGRKTIILISEGLRGMMRDAQTLLTDLTRAANDNNTAIYTLDPRGFGMQRFSSLLEGVALDTGAEAFRTNDFEQAFNRVVQQSSAYYLLGYAPIERAMDGRFHKIKVRVKKSGLEVRARSGYWAPSVAEVENAKRRAAASVIPADMGTAFGELAPAGARRTVDVWIGTTPRPDGRVDVRLLWLPRAAPATSAAQKPSQVSAVAARNEERLFEGLVEPSGVSFEAPPGPLKIGFVVRNSAGEVIDGDSRTIEIADPAAAPLSISTPLVFRMQNALEYRTFATNPAPLPHAGREFVPSDRLIVRFAVQGAAAPQATLETSLVNKQGKPVAPLTATRSKDDPARYEIDLPLATVVRGDFLISITATGGEQRVRALVPFRMLR